MAAGPYSFGPFHLDVDRRHLTQEGVPVKLGSKATDILCLLVDARGEVVTKGELMARVWQGIVVEENAIQVHVSALRKALDQVAAGSGAWVVVSADFVLVKIQRSEHRHSARGRGPLSR
jgi:DNA-binding winged helix-turn-helix (wHTH) protein